jgi:hypothetical protein
MAGFARATMSGIESPKAECSTIANPMNRVHERASLHKIVFTYPCCINGCKLDSFSLERFGYWGMAAYLHDHYKVKLSSMFDSV